MAIRPKYQLQIEERISDYPYRCYQMKLKLFYKKKLRHVQDGSIKKLKRYVRLIKNSWHYESYA